LAFVAGLTYSVRPVGAAVVVATLMVALHIWHAADRRRTLAYAIALLPLVLTVGGETTLKLSLHEPTQHSLASIHVFAKAGMVDANVPEGTAENEQSQVVLDVLENDLSSVRHLIATAPTSYVARHLTVYYETFVQYRFALKERAAAASAAPLHDTLMHIGLQRLRHGLGGYANLTFQLYMSLWNFYDASYPGHARIYNDYLAANTPLPLSDIFPEIATPAQTTSQLGWVVRPAIQVMGLLTAALAAAGLFFLARPQNAPPLLVTAGTIALLIHGYCLLVALTGLGIPRYLLVLWPVIISALGLTAWHFIGTFIGHTHRRG
jgi:hypothetical protein